MKCCCMMGTSISISNILLVSGRSTESPVERHIVLVGSTQTFQTKVVKGGGKNARRECNALSTLAAQMGRNVQLQRHARALRAQSEVEVWDKDTFTADDMIGSGVLQLKPILTGANIAIVQSGKYTAPAWAQNAKNYFRSKVRVVLDMTCCVRLNAMLAHSLFASTASSVDGAIFI
eukprot:592056-Hanusia_phi.AAC.1